MENIVRVDQESAEPLESAGFTIYRGWSEDLAQRLVERSREDEMLRWVPRDAAERFVDADAAHEWYRSKERVVYSLARRAILGGVIWFSHAPREEYEAEYTFAIRMYEDSRGQRAAGPFMAASHGDLEESYGNVGNIWLETDADNLAALKLYVRQGYEIVDEKEGRITMLRRAGVAAIHASGP
jgi:ribosomal protein S18 acetylase RimI-like enzyme